MFHKSYFSIYYLTTGFSQYIEFFGCSGILQSKAIGRRTCCDGISKIIGKKDKRYKVRHLLSILFIDSKL